jgi:CubicO group peptidase (beta-lactamase class C family)
MRSIGFVFLLLIIAFWGCQPVDQTSDIYSNAIQEGHRLLDSLQQAGKVPGIDVAVAIDGEIVWSEGFGFADLEHQAPVIAGKTRFRIGSVSKPITAAALGKLIDKGEIDLENAVQTYVPYFPEKAYPITVKQVAGHIGGIRHYRGEEFLMSRYFPTVKSGISIFMEDSLLFEPGARYSYSSYGYNLISAVIEGASGEDFLRYMQNEIFGPLGMTLTTADRNDSIIVHRTSVYQIDSLGNIANAPYVDNSYKWAGGGFISTTTDLVKFGEAHMTQGFLSEPTLREFTTSQVLNNGDSTHYGVGWSVFKDGDLMGYGHGGGSVGGITAFRVYPSEKMVLVILSNSSDTRYGDIPVTIVRLFVEAKHNPV